MNSKEKINCKLQKCQLCHGSGGYKGYWCVRCGGYKHIPSSCSNSNELSEEEHKQLELEMKLGLNKIK